MCPDVCSGVIVIYFSLINFSSSNIENVSVFSLIRILTGGIYMYVKNWNFHWQVNIHTEVKTCAATNMMK